MTSFRFAGGRGAAGVPARPVPHPARARRRRPGPGADVLPVGRPRRRVVPDQREARVARAGQRATCTRTCSAATGSRWRRRAVTSCSTRGPEPVLLVSAGIGLTPLLAMLHRLADETSAREVWWIHTTHDADSHAFAAEVADLLGRLPSAHSLVYYTTPDAAARAGLGHPGRAPHRATVIAGPGPARRTRPPMSAGPESFMDDVAAALAGRRHRPDRDPHRAVRLAVRRSTPASSATDAPPPHQPPGPPGTGPSVTFARSGLTTAWSDRYALGPRAGRGVRRARRSGRAAPASATPA